MGVRKVGGKLPAVFRKVKRFQGFRSLTVESAPDKVARSVMADTILMRRARAALLALALAGSPAACGDDLNADFPRPSGPVEVTLYDVFAGPIDRPSGVDLVQGTGSSGVPRPVRIDLTENWDVAFAVLNGSATWLPRGFFDGFEASSGIVALDLGFDEVERVPEDRTLYETEQPVPVVQGTTYAIRSRNNPVVSLPCRIFGKMVVDELQLDPARVSVRILWNPNCDQRVVTPENR